MARLVPCLAGTRRQPRNAMEINELPVFPGHITGRGAPAAAVRIPDALCGGVRDPDAFRTATDAIGIRQAPGFGRWRPDGCPTRSAPGAGTRYALVSREWQRNVVKLMKNSVGSGRLIIEAVAGMDLAIGTHLVTDRLWYTHHGVYAGAGKVVHYAGLSRSLRRGPVDEVTLAEFAHGHPVWVRQSPGARFVGVEVVQRAYSRIGEDRYRLISNNCEHFCMWCLYGESRSDQIDVWKFRASDVLAAAFKVVRRLTATAAALVATVRFPDTCGCNDRKPDTFGWFAAKHKLLI